ncbi:MAG TPA: FAD-dependent oxidoreductase [Thermoanaerobaculia bacterium]|nr:FAD-dependent oxidoreductase [Thermoanaerobaculia bacterium]
MNDTTDVLVLGTGVAGCAAALAAARGGAEVTLVTRAAQARESNTYYAQGGIVARPPGDTPEQLARDIERAGDGLCFPDAVELLAREGPDLVEKLLVEELAVPFDREGSGFHWTLEGAHSVPRVLHVKDETGAPIERGLIAACRNETRIRWRLETTAVDLLTLSHDSVDATDRYRPPAVIGAYLLNRRIDDGVQPLLARETILATGGLGQVYLHTTNPQGARGDGIAMARRAGARLLNLEFIQFHPTALVHARGRLLLTEALRGEGARITDVQGRPFLHQVHPDAELAPRDVVARAIHKRMLENDEPHALLDISYKPAAWIRERFPGLTQRCQELGFDLTAGPVPVVPAAHYSGGGVAVDGDGRTTLGHLRAVGEVSCTGVHGANRLASTSLLEGLLWGWRAGVAAADRARQSSGRHLPNVRPWQPEHEPVDPALIAQDWMVIRHTMWNYVGLLRSEKRLDRAGRILSELQVEIEDFYRRGTMSDDLVGLRNGVQTALAIRRAASDNRVSRGSHYREDGRN